MKRKIKVLHAPINFANQAYVFSNALRDRNIDSTLLMYRWKNIRDTCGNSRNTYGIGEGTVKDIRYTHWLYDQFCLLDEVLSQGYNIYHFWHRSLVYRSSVNMLDGIDLPILKGAGARLLQRFTGYDLRRKSEELEFNPYAPSRYGFDQMYDEERQRVFLDYMKSYVDEFIVQDPEMQSYLPKATIIPRALNIDDYEPIPSRRTDRPLVVHAPTNRTVKGSEFILKALDELAEEGLKFDVKLLEGLPNSEILAWQRKADVVVDQLLVGWYGVVSMEAMAYGKPVIAYIRPDLEATFANGMPLINANPDTIKDKLRLAITDFDCRQEIGERGRQHVENTHDSRVVARQAEDVYHRLLRSRRGRKVRPDLSLQISEAEDFSDLVNKGRAARSSYIPELTKLRSEVRTLKRRLAEAEEGVEAGPASSGPPAATSSAPEQGGARANHKEPGDAKQQQVTPLQSNEVTNV